MWCALVSAHRSSPLPLSPKMTTTVFFSFFSVVCTGKLVVLPRTQYSQVNESQTITLQNCCVPYIMYFTRQNSILCYLFSPPPPSKEHGGRWVGVWVGGKDASMYTWSKLLDRYTMWSIQDEHTLGLGQRSFFAGLQSGLIRTLSAHLFRFLSPRPHTRDLFFGEPLLLEEWMPSGILAT